MSKKIDRALILVMSLLFVLVSGSARSSAEEPATLEFRASDKSFTVQTVEDYRVAYNPHAVLSLASLDEVAVVVTKRKAEQSIDKIYDNYPKSLPADYPCQGRMMITMDGEQAAAFVVEGMFPPEGEPTHQTLMAITLHDGQEYNFMIHYPLENEKTGMENAYALLSTVKWTQQPSGAAKP